MDQASLRRERAKAGIGVAPFAATAPPPQPHSQHSPRMPSKSLSDGKAREQPEEPALSASSEELPFGGDMNQAMKAQDRAAIRLISAWRLRQEMGGGQSGAGEGGGDSGKSKAATATPLEAAKKTAAAAATPAMAKPAATPPTATPPTAGSDDDSIPELVVVATVIGGDAASPSGTSDSGDAGNIGDLDGIHDDDPSGALSQSTVDRVVAAAHNAQGQQGFKLFKRLRKVIAKAISGEVKYRKLR